MYNKIKVLPLLTLMHIALAPEIATQFPDTDLGNDALAARRQISQLLRVASDELIALGRLRQACLTVDEALRHEIKVFCNTPDRPKKLLSTEQVKFSTEMNEGMRATTEVKMRYLSSDFVFYVNSDNEIYLYVHKNGIVNEILLGKFKYITYNELYDILRPCFRELIGFRLIGNECLDPIRSSDLPGIKNLLEGAGLNLTYSHAIEIIMRATGRASLDSVTSENDILHILFKTPQDSRNMLENIHDIARGVLLYNPFHALHVSECAESPYLVSITPEVCFEVDDPEHSLLSKQRDWTVFKSDEFLSRETQKFAALYNTGEHVFRFEYKSASDFLQTTMEQTRPNDPLAFCAVNKLHSERDGENAKNVGEIYPVSAFPSFSDPEPVQDEPQQSLQSNLRNLVQHIKRRLGSVVLNRQYGRLATIICLGRNA